MHARGAIPNEEEMEEEETSAHSRDFTSREQTASSLVGQRRRKRAKGEREGCKVEVNL